MQDTVEPVWSKVRLFLDVPEFKLFLIISTPALPNPTLIRDPILKMVDIKKDLDRRRNTAFRSKSNKVEKMKFLNSRFHATENIRCPCGNFSNLILLGHKLLKLRSVVIT